MFLLLSKISFYGTTLILIILILVLSFKLNNRTENKINEVSNEYIASYLDGEYQTEIPGKNDGYVVDKIVCDNGASATWDNEEWGINIRNATKKIKCSIYFVFKTEYVFDYTGAEQVFTVPKTGTYKIETWGASGNDTASWNTGGETSVAENSYGLGGYTNGKISLSKDTKLFVYVGGKNAYNGGGLGEAAGGGATDIRIVENNLYSRIIVAAGGGGGLFNDSTKLIQRGSGGGLYGYDADAIINSSLSYNGATTGFSGHGGTQVLGGLTGSYGYDAYEVQMDGSFGHGGQHISSTDTAYRASGGGGGWYGGGHGRHTKGTWSGGGGGSSYISGHSGCLAVSSSTSTELKNGCTENSTSLECSISYTGYYFTDTVMIDGAGYKWTTQKGEYTGMPSHDGTRTITGNAGNGYARITFIE